MSGQMTISFNKANSTSLAHNNRENLFGNPDIDLERVKDNIMYVKSDIREMYHEIFDQAVADYNAKQKRSDRKIDDYFSKITLYFSLFHPNNILFLCKKLSEQ